MPSDESAALNRGVYCLRRGDAFGRAVLVAYDHLGREVKRRAVPPQWELYQAWDEFETWLDRHHPAPTLEVVPGSEAPPVARVAPVVTPAAVPAVFRRAAEPTRVLLLPPPPPRRHRPLTPAGLNPLYLTRVQSLILFGPRIRRGDPLPRAYVRRERA